MSAELVETLNGIGGWVGMMLGILYIYNRNTPLGAYDMLFILSSPVMSAAALNTLFFGTGRILIFVFHVYSTMLQHEVQIMAAYLLFSTSLLSGMVYTIHNLEKMRLTDNEENKDDTENNEVDDGEGEVIDEEDVDVVYENDAGEVDEDGSTVEDEVVYEQDQGEVADDTEEASDEETDKVDDEDNFADDEADENLHKEIDDKIGLSIIGLYRKMYGTMFTNQ